MLQYLRYSFLAMSLVTSPAIATDLQEKVNTTPTAKITHERLPSDVAQVKQYAQTRPELTLVLGEVADNFLKGHKKYTNDYVFLDTFHKAELPGQRISADFNNLADLAFLAEHLNGTFSKILVDHGTWFIASWSQAHFGFINAMLKKGGVFQFNPSAMGGNPLESAQDIQTLKANIKDSWTQSCLEPSTFQKFKHFSLGAIRSGVLSVLPELSESDQQFVEEQVRNYREIAHFALTCAEQKMIFEGQNYNPEKAVLINEKYEKYKQEREKRGLKSAYVYTQEDILEDDTLQTEFKLNCISRRFNTEVHQEVYYPYVRKFLLQVFSEVDFVTEAYPQYPDEIVTFAKATK